MTVSVHVCAKAPSSKRDLDRADFHRTCGNEDDAIDELSILVGEFGFAFFKKGGTYYTLNDIGEVVEVTFH